MQQEHPPAVVDPPLVTEGIGVTAYGSLGQSLLPGASDRIRESTPLLAAMRALGDEIHPA